jgi:hypothetical protein
VRIRDGKDDRPARVPSSCDSFDHGAEKLNGTEIRVVIDLSIRCNACVALHSRKKSGDADDERERAGRKMNHVMRSVAQTLNGFMYARFAAFHKKDDRHLT